MATGASLNPYCLQTCLPWQVKNKMVVKLSKRKDLDLVKRNSDKFM